MDQTQSMLKYRYGFNVGLRYPRVEKDGGGENKDFRADD